MQQYSNRTAALYVRATISTVSTVITRITKDTLCLHEAWNDTYILRDVCDSEQNRPYSYMAPLPKPSPCKLLADPN